MLSSKNYCKIESEASYDDERKEADEGKEVRYDTDKIKSLLLYGKIKQRKHDSKFATLTARQKSEDLNKVLSQEAEIEKHLQDSYIPFTMNLKNPAN